MSSARSLLRFATALVAALVLAACATGPRVAIDSDTAADFSKYRTFAFFDPIALESRGYTTLLSAQMRQEIRREMEARGFVFDESSPDLLVNFNALIEERREVVAVPDLTWGWFYGYRGAYFGGPFMHDRLHTTRVTEGTVSIDLVDADEKRLVWEGVAVGNAAGRTPAERRERALRSVASIFQSFPHRAGAATPPAATAAR